MAGERSDKRESAIRLEIQLIDLEIIMMIYHQVESMEKFDILGYAKNIALLPKVATNFQRLWRVTYHPPSSNFRSNSYRRNVGYGQLQNAVDLPMIHRLTRNLAKHEASAIQWNLSEKAGKVV